MSKFDTTLSHDGEAMPLRDWAARLGLAPGSLYNRIRKDGVDRALSRRALSFAEAGRRGSRRSGWRKEAAAGVLNAEARLSAAA